MKAAPQSGLLRRGFGDDEFFTDELEDVALGEAESERALAAIEGFLRR